MPTVTAGTPVNLGNCPCCGGPCCVLASPATMVVAGMPTFHGYSYNGTWTVTGAYDTGTTPVPAGGGTIFSGTVYCFGTGQTSYNTGANWGSTGTLPFIDLYCVPGSGFVMGMTSYGGSDLNDSADGCCYVGNRESHLYTVTGTAYGGLGRPHFYPVSWSCSDGCYHGTYTMNNHKQKYDSRYCYDNPDPTNYTIVDSDSTTTFTITICPPPPESSSSSVSSSSGGMGMVADEPPKDFDTMRKDRSERKERSASLKGDCGCGQADSARKNLRDNLPRKIQPNPLD